MDVFPYCRQKSFSQETKYFHLQSLSAYSKEAETEICKKIESQMINVSVRGIKCFSLNTENKSQASYKINIVMQDASDFRNTELYHIAL